MCPALIVTYFMILSTIRYPLITIYISKPMPRLQLHYLCQARCTVSTHSSRMNAAITVEAIVYVIPYQQYPKNSIVTKSFSFMDITMCIIAVGHSLTQRLHAWSFIDFLNGYSIFMQHFAYDPNIVDGHFGRDGRSHNVTQ